MKKTTRILTIAIMTILMVALAGIATFAASTTVNEGSRVTVSATVYGDIDQNDVDWTSSNSKVATISNETVNGHTVKAVVTAKKAGKATIKADVNGREIEYNITVNHIAPTKKNTTAAYTQLNKYRKAKKLKGLKRDAKLEKIALQRAKEMAETGKFSHTRPNGKSGLTLIKGKKAKGENIAMGQTTCAQVSKDWYKSPGHRKNMLRKNFKKVGIAGYTYKGRTYWAQVFSS